MGLSPRVRGNRTLDMAAATSLGSIPACAGEPSCRRPLLRSPTVYPRVCGGTTARRRRPLLSGGLSPRVRGNRTSDFSLRTMIGSIPACAGEPRGGPSSCNIPRVYPRVCGGTKYPDPRDFLPDGLSPRVRGNHPERPTLRVHDRSIPACAGEPAASRPHTKKEPVYPRVCGGTPISTGRSPSIAGLSPRVRGNHQRFQFRHPPEGSIPACAGEPAQKLSNPFVCAVYPRVCGGTQEY